LAKNQLNAGFLLPKNLRQFTKRVKTAAAAYNQSIQLLILS
jgi:hypothetical protein